MSFSSLGAGGVNKAFSEGLLIIGPSFNFGLWNERVSQRSLNSQTLVVLYVEFVYRIDVICANPQLQLEQLN